MPNEDSELYISEFNTNIQLLSQQSKNRFAGWTMVGSHKGKQASPVDQVGSTAVQQRTGRAQPKILTDIENERRWVQPTSFHIHTVVDDFDKIRMNVSLDSPFLKVQMNAMHREMEDAMIAAMFATATVGEEGGSTVSFALTAEVMWPLVQPTLPLQNYLQLNRLCLKPRSIWTILKRR